MSRLHLAVAIAGIAVLILTSSCGQSPVEPLSQSPAKPVGLDTVTPFATVSRTDLGTLGGASSFATDVNDAGIVVGWSKTATAMDHAFRWTESQGMTNLGTLPGDQWSRALSITNSGQILGVSGGSGTGSSIGTPVLWDRSGSATALPIPLLPGAGWMSLADRNASGEVVGNDYGGSIPASHAWVWNESLGIYDISRDIPSGSETYANDINASGLVLGTNWARGVCTNHHTVECWHVFVWNSSTGYRDLGIPEGSELRSAAVTGSAMNDGGVVVGWTIPNPDSGGMYAYRWSENIGFVLLPTFSGGSAYAYADAVNLAGTAVGASKDAQVGAIQAAAWPKAGGIVKLSPDDPNASVAVAINASGTAVGWSIVGTTNHATLWKLSPGRGASTPTAVQAHSLTRTAVIQSGPVGCLSDPRAIMSRQLLIDCVGRRDN